MPDLYTVLRVQVHRTTQQTPWSVPAELSYWHRTEMIPIGTANSMQEAKRKYGGRPILEEKKD